MDVIIMNKKINKIIDDLSHKINDDDFLEFAEEKTEELNSFDNANEAIEPILKLMEDNPNTDFGMPGSLVHFAEQYFKHGYEEILISSLRRTPTSHTLWMLNRIINGLQGDIKSQFIMELKEITKRTDIDDLTRNSAKDFYSTQHNNLN